MKKLIAIALVLVMVLGFAAVGQAEGFSYPFKNVTMIVPYGAGGTTDLIGRALAASLGDVLGVTFVVENQPGASGAIGCQAVLDAPHDGSTVLFVPESLGMQRTMALSDLCYDDFRPAMIVANDPKVIVVAGDSPYNTIEDLLNAIKENPNKIQMAYTGPGGSGHVQALIMNQCGYEPALTAYTKASECIVGVMGGQVEFFNSNYSTVAAYIESGDLKMLANCANERLEKYPDVPALGEYLEGAEKFLNLEYCPCNIMVAADCPEDVYNTLFEACKVAVQDEKFVKFIEDNCMDKLYEKYHTEEEMRAFYKEWESTVSWLLYDAGAAHNCPADFGIERIG